MDGGAVEEVDGCTVEEVLAPSGSESTAVEMMFRGLVESLCPRMLCIAAKKGQVPGVARPPSVPSPVRGRIRSCVKQLKLFHFHTSIC